MTHLVKSTTRKSDKNFWATTWSCFADATALFGRPFQLDVCAEQATRKCLRYFTLPEVDALCVDWDDGWYCNPPFDNKQAFIKHAHKQARQGRAGMMLLPYEPATNWWRKLLSKGVIVYEPDGRYPFLERDGMTKKDGVNFPSALILFPAHTVNASIRIPFTRGMGKHLIDTVTLSHQLTIEHHAPMMQQAVSHLSNSGLSVTGVAMSDDAGNVTAVVAHNGNVTWCKQLPEQEQEVTAHGSDRNAQ